MPPAWTGARRLIVQAALVAALIFQSLVAQGHFHPAPLQRSSETSARIHAPGAPDSPADCPLCREIAQAGHYLVPTPILFIHRATSFVRPFVAAPLSWTGHRHSHGWRSRGPPN